MSVSSRFLELNFARTRMLSTGNGSPWSTCPDSSVKG